MPVLQFKGKTAVENYHHTVPHHRLEFDAQNLDWTLVYVADSQYAPQTVAA